MTTLLDRRFTVGGLPTIDLGQIPTDVKITRGPAESVSVKVTGPEKYRTDVSAEQSEDTVTVRGPRNYSSCTIISVGGHTKVTNLRSAGSVVISGSRVVIDGRDVTDMPADGKDSEPLLFELIIPEDSRLTLRDVGKLECEVRISKARLNVSGQSELRIDTVTELTGRISGQSELSIAHFVGRHFQLTVSGQSEIEVAGFNETELDIDLSGQGEARFDGNFSSVQATASGQSKIETRGTVSGNYDATASGMSEITHRGRVVGSISRNANGMSEINIK